MTSECFESAYTKGFPRVVKFLRHRGSDPELANELTQAAFVRGWERMHTLRQPERFIEFVISVAVNFYRDEMRKRARLTNFDGAFQIKVGPTVSVDMIDLRRAIKRFPSRQQTLTNEVYIQGRTPDEAARALGISKGAVEHRLSRMKQQLRKKMNAA
jgi:RNA polymerase sigma-70 factor, ECF subfamily